jgi:hypothetical protein
MARNVAEEERLFKRVLKAYRNCDNPKLNRFTVETNLGLTYVEGRDDGVYIEATVANKVLNAVFTAVAAANYLIGHDAKAWTIQKYV